MGEFPQGESTAGTQDDAETTGSEGEPGTEDPGGSEEAGEGETEPGFDSGDYAAGDDDSLPDMRDETSLEDALESLEEAMGDAAGGPSAGDTAAGDTAAGDSAQAGSSGDYAAEGEAAGASSPGGTEAAGSQASTGDTGPLTHAEQAAILQGQLERGTGEFDAMILDEQAAQRRAAREQVPGGTQTADSTDTASGGEGDGFEEGVAEAGDYSSGGGIGGVSRSGGSVGMPQNTAKYPPPANIPSGNDDDVVARQLREAAMREPDPVMREKLWDEYRKYKGID